MFAAPLPGGVAVIEDQGCGRGEIVGRNCRDMGLVLCFFLNAGRAPVDTAKGR